MGMGELFRARRRLGREFGEGLLRRGAVLVEGARMAFGGEQRQRGTPTVERFVVGAGG